MSQTPEMAAVLMEAGRVVMSDYEKGSKHKVIVMAPIKGLQRDSYCYRKDCKRKKRRETNRRMADRGITTLGPMIL